MTETGWQPVRRHAPADGARAACALGAAGLLACLLATRWFGAVGAGQGLERTGHGLALGGWEALTITRWGLVGLCAGGLAVGLLGRRLGPARGLVVVLAAAATAGLGFRILIDPPQPARIVDVKLGGYLALLCALAVTLGAADAWRRGRDGALPRRR